ncbi:uncharacterized protein MONBRDRAFT_32048 [Monosiga brevicollis MX1]|uniref:R3H domain-containing protein n=1 Tax=Monosiga brevicollis TaxID=81824 RepID=A9UX25_MONBE|nr:uncharacterized protein MONBRDRAFT_32048 [Monosiga brevicollis MX1]EDQ90319.1 predicted protein [Monosiga brevicollis MX1]|eukprot:XP_001745086.1 hypothetical protein [Monosiga brevicollis MX1]
MPHPEWTAEERRYYESVVLCSHSALFATGQLHKSPACMNPLTPAVARVSSEMILYLQGKELKRPLLFQNKSQKQRRMIHEIAEHLGLHHDSHGHRTKKSRVVEVMVPAPEVRRQEADDFQILQQALRAYRKLARESSHELAESNTELPPGYQPGTQHLLRYASWNIEWFNALFLSDTEFNLAVPSQDIADVNDLLERIACVIVALDADLLAVQEGPSNLQRMTLFIERYLDSAFSVIGGLEPHEAQQLYFLVRREGPLRNVRLVPEAQAFLQQPWHFDVDGNLHLQEYRFQRIPLLIQAELDVPASVCAEQGSVCSNVPRNDIEHSLHLEDRVEREQWQQEQPGLAFAQDTLDFAELEARAVSPPGVRVADGHSGASGLPADRTRPTTPTVQLTERRVVFACTLHAKSKHVANGRSRWESHNDADKQEFIQQAVKNRRRIVGECLRLRECLNRFVFARHENPLLVVSGDLNAGPGMDFFERFYLMTSGLDALMGSPFNHNKMLQALLIRSRFVSPASMYTAIFDDYVDGVPSKRVLIDHICVSRALFQTTRRAGVAHELFEQFSDARLEGRARHPSDHRPIWADLI